MPLAMPASHPSPDTSCANTGTVLAFDFGLKRTGVAVGDAALRLAHALTVIEAESNQARFAAIAHLIDEWQPALLIVGLPLTLEGSEHAMSTRCRRFGNQLKGRFGLPVKLADERLTSAAAEEQLRAAGLDWKKRRARVDALAAQLILQGYFDVAS